MSEHTYDYHYGQFAFVQNLPPSNQSLNKKSRDDVKKSRTSSILSSRNDTSLNSMLVTGFGMRNVDSLQRALMDDEQRRQLLLEKYGQDMGYECDSIASFSTVDTEGYISKSIDESSQSGQSMRNRQLEYLLGSTAGGGEEYLDTQRPIPPAQVEIFEEVDDGKTTLAMRRAQKYLRSHQVFEFLQFLIVHMLGAVPDNPINFLLDLLDRCLIYRSGLGQPPLVYEKAHLEQLFYLMDRMRTGFVDVQQYKTGMITLGICSYNKKPPLLPDGMVAKVTFIEEAYGCLVGLLDDMIRRRGRVTPPSLITPPPTMIGTDMSDHSDFMDINSVVGGGQ